MQWYVVIQPLPFSLSDFLLVAHLVSLSALGTHHPLTPRIAPAFDLSCEL